MENYIRIPAILSADRQMLAARRCQTYLGPRCYGCLLLFVRSLCYIIPMFCVMVLLSVSGTAPMYSKVGNQPANPGQKNPGSDTVRVERSDKFAFNKHGNDIFDVKNTSTMMQSSSASLIPLKSSTESPSTKTNSFMTSQPPDSSTLPSTTSTNVNTRVNRHHTPPPGPVRKFHFNQDGRPVLLVTHMRSGSTFLGQMFNQIPQTFYWYEPVDAIYESMYGTKTGYAVPSDITTFQNGTARKVPAHEERIIIKAVANILSCKFEQLPTQLLVTSFLQADRLYMRHFRGYNTCVKMFRPFYDTRKCSVFLFHMCPSRFGANWGRRDNCFERLNPEKNLDEDGYYIIDDKYNHDPLLLAFLKVTTLNFKMDDDFLPYLFSVTRDEKSNTTDRGSQRPRIDPMSEDSWKLLGMMIVTELAGNERRQLNLYKACMNDMRDVAMKCVSQLKSLCYPARVRSLKTIRMSLSTAVKVASELPGLKIVYNIREPIAIAKSRSEQRGYSYMSMYSGKDKDFLKEAEIVCRVMEEDLAFLRTLNESFSQRIFINVYENHTKDISLSTEKIHDFMGLKTGRFLMRWISKNAQQKPATSWKEKVTVAEYLSYLKFCKPVLQKYTDMVPWSSHIDMDCS